MAFQALLAAFVLLPNAGAFPLTDTNPLIRRANATSASSGFVQGPDGRGSLNLVTSCLGTLLLCAASTAMHLNVPGPSECSIIDAGRRIWWMIMAAFAPEFVLFRALEQFTAARDLKNAVNKIGQSAAAGAQLVRHPLPKAR
jgi:hypothetical protein